MSALARFYVLPTRNPMHMLLDGTAPGSVTARSLPAHGNLVAVMGLF